MFTLTKWSLQNVGKRHANAMSGRMQAVGVDVVEGLHKKVMATLLLVPQLTPTMTVPLAQVSIK